MFIIRITVLPIKKKVFFAVSEIAIKKERKGAGEKREREIFNFHPLYLSQLVIVHPLERDAKFVHTACMGKRNIFFETVSANVPLRRYLSNTYTVRIYISKRENRTVCV